MQVYKREGLLREDVMLGQADATCLDLLVHHPHSIFRLLDETCRLVALEKG